MFEKHSAKLVYLFDGIAIPPRKNDAENAISSPSSSQEEPDHPEPTSAQGLNVPDKIPRELSVERYHIVCFTFSIISYIIDVGSDIVLGIEHALADRYISSMAIFVFALVPSIVLNVVSFIWICDDNAERRRNRSPTKEEDGVTRKHTRRDDSYFLHALLCILQLGPIWWMYKALCYALIFRNEKEDEDKNKRKWFCRMIEAERDATLLRVFEGFLEAAPQLVVQTTILVQYISTHVLESNQKINTWVYHQCISIGISLFSLCWSITSQHRTIRMARHDKVNVHIHETIIQFVWRLLTISARLTVLVLAVLRLGPYVIPLFLIHLLISLCHVTALQFYFLGVIAYGAFRPESLQNVVTVSALNSANIFIVYSLTIDTGTNSRALDTALLVVNALIHTFTVFNIAEGGTRLRFAVAYFIEIVEAIALLSFCWYFDGSSLSMLEDVTVFIGVGYIFGILTMIVYYSCFHPNRRRHKRLQENDVPLGEENNDQ